MATPPVGTSPRSIACDCDYAWVTNQGSNTVSVIDLVNNPGATVTLSGFNQPWDVITDYPGIVFVSNKGNGTVVAIYPQTKQVLRTFPGRPGSDQMALTGVHIYVANSGSNSVSMINLDTNTVSAPIRGGQQPDGTGSQPQRHMGVRDEPGLQYGLGDQRRHQHHRRLASIPVGSQPTSVVISPDSSLAYVANSDDTVSVIDTAPTRWCAR